ncbi:hypothetical protein AMS68_007990 [Peltaster fructicola]|uniref:Mitochondrial import inner membrane translocase subunit TIM54 n=1 Tax=Peltaster fructicola TaxID=286661 RepID=A0A6H0Y644_9PEZI|nr:hypothetical protein AMS68_007990 [Peltaster fructicola]
MSEPGKGVAGDAAGTVAKDAAKGAAATAADAAKKALPDQNPALKMMGLPRFRLPSRNWMIFLGITGSFAAAITYDRWQTRKTKEKWCNLVSHLADEPLDIKQLPRTLTVYLSAPPGDGLRSAREHFHNYVKPILVAAAVNWDVVEGRKEGDVRYKTAERIRRQRRLGGEGTPVDAEDYSVEQMRKNSGVIPFEGAAGDLVIGRHTWKEYIRGMHEGWLGPVDTPTHVDEAMGVLPKPLTGDVVPAAAAATSDVTPIVTELQDITAQAESSADGSAGIPTDTTTEEKSEEKAKEEEEEKPKPRQPPAFITPDAYPTAIASRLLPDTLEPSAPVSCPHILGFRNTPIRFYRYLTRRRLADDIGRQVAGAVLGLNRGFDTVTLADNDSPSGTASTQPEQAESLLHEERDWWKTVRQPRKEFEESVLIEPMVFDDRITSRMRKFELGPADEQRANALAGSKPDGT